MLTQAKARSETAKYLLYILSNGRVTQTLNLSASELTLVRSSAAINLKNLVRSNFKNLDEPTKDYVRAHTISCLEDANSQIRSLTGTVITEIVQKSGILSWSELLPQLLSIAANEKGGVSEAAQEGSMGALTQLCEDRAEELDHDYEGQSPLQFIIPRLLKITNSPIPRVRALTVASINSFLPQKSETIINMLDAILDHLFRLAGDPNPDVRRHLCRFFVLVVDIRPDRIQPHMDGLVAYMCLQQKNTDDPESALEAAEFWLAVSENSKMCPALEPFLNKIIPVLLDSMVYDEDTVIRLSGDIDDAGIEDRSEDIKPRFAASKASRTFTNGQKLTSDDVEEGEIEDDEDGDVEPEDEWNLRKCSAAALDVLASNFHRLVFDIALGYLNNNLTHTEWPYREAAVLAIGAVAEGCLDAVAPALPNIVPYLTSLLKDDEPSVRLITCWALGRYSVWALNLGSEGRTQYFTPMLNGILGRMMDKNKRVQIAAASAFANMGEKAGKALGPHSENIIRTFVACFGIYKDRNIFVLYDCVQTLADQIGPELRNPGLLELLMPALINRWEKISDQSQELFPLHECLAYIAAALGNAFAPFAGPTFARCIRIVHGNLNQSHMAVDDSSIEKPNKDFLVTSLDLLSAIIQALEPSQSAELVQSAQPSFFDLVVYCIQDPSNDVRQSSYALLGDCAVNVFPQLHPSLKAILPVALRQLDLNHVKSSDSATVFSVINNACWSCGEIAMKYDVPEMMPYTLELYHKLKAIIDQLQIPFSVRENAVIAIGRLGVRSPSVVAPQLAEFVQQFLQIIEPVEQTDEKAHAFLGLNSIVRQNPYGMIPHLLPYVQACLAYSKESKGPRDQSESIGDSFQQVCYLSTDMKTLLNHGLQVLSGYKALNGDYFGQVVRQLSLEQQQRLKISYNLA